MRPYIFLLLILFACKKNDRFKDEQLSPVSVAISSENGIVNIPGSENYTKATDDITIPVKLVFSAATPKIFTVNIGVDNDTVNTLINHQQLGNAVLLDESYYTLPGTAEIRFGLDTFSIPLKVSMQAIERYYGHDLALAVRLSDATKENTLDATGQMAIILIHTDKVIAESEIHYLYFTKAGSVLLEPDGTDHTLGNTEVTLPVSVTLGGTAGGAFSINLSAAPDTAQALIDNGTLAGSVLLASGTDYTLPATVNFPANTNVAKFNLTVKTASIINNVNNKPVLAIQLSDPTRHLLDSSKSTIVLELDPSKLIETDITNQNIKYTTQYENGNANENSPKLIDNNTNTKFLLGSFSTVWAMLEFDTPQTTGAYTMTSANDAPDRDPKDWTIEGSNNGTDWVVVDKRVDQNFGSRFLTVKYTFSNQDAYKFYRLYVTATHGSSLYQQAEWRLIKRP
ncbi:MAG: hypothetical protein H6Q26_210 [Bacteroidetes bacterium]|uniref:BT_3987 domain-containing protein n=1 Tax=Chitinophaga sp. LS1 TaxID=3051176 RepID=UPI001DF22888|nr:DUF1735 domain-containing protein [Chitinophaga sp. LS1]MBP1650053.1 hypothetical protein [Bacteroidota bacterium]WPV69716.1 DUF1735 domain-containing protein [Chitinophaga sp. LS1]